MLKELLEMLANAKDDKEKADAYRYLRSVGMDKTTADFLLQHREEWE
jgi:hypothetical protein